MPLDYTHFLINFKRYEGTAGDAGLDLAQTIEAVGSRTDATFAVAPQTPDVRLLAEETSLPIVAQAIDAVEPGRGNGEISIQAVAAAGADGVLINHPESPDTLTDVEAFVAECASFGLESIVCVDSVEAGRAALAFDPDCLLFETPADIATGRAMTRSHPGRVEAFVAMVDLENPRTRVLLGGGITDAADVADALDSGADAAGAASAFMNADDRDAWLSAVADALTSG
ncbi:triose-phosphate isomerase [Natronomonas salsuginis]|uniref:Triose-phosphate isomerase n=1 Tax=Natronomonas salsuginis TaxID=2217661 RepID=A0A4V5ZPI2_9EURY|nr:triose-phosphate isomerase [Natronomonas salsuginis]TKR27883.1 triose-phosphate isomerase [Natronomonas salsuginis]